MTRAGDGDGDTRRPEVLDESHRTGPGAKRIGPRRTPRGDAEEESDAERSDETYYCDLCGSVMLNLHCKLVCETCGYKRDCSDP